MTATSVPRQHADGGGESSFRRKALAIAAFLILAASVLNALFGERGFFRLMRAREDYQALNQEVQALEQENQRLAEEIGSLRADPLVIERIAREVLGMARENEIAVSVRNPSERER
jgi:cell division protein FtsB